MTPEQTHALAQASRVVASDEGCDVLTAEKKCRSDPCRVEALGKAFVDLAGALKADEPAAPQAPSPSPEPVIAVIAEEE